MNRNGLSRRGLLALAAAAPLVGQKTRALDGFVSILRAAGFGDRVPGQRSTRAVPLRIGLVRARYRTPDRAAEHEDADHHRGARCSVDARPVALVGKRGPSAGASLNDHWERSYGDLEWRGMLGERVLPWQFLAFDGMATHGYGVETGCCGIRLLAGGPGRHLAVGSTCANGGGPVRLGKSRAPRGYRPRASRSERRNGLRGGAATSPELSVRIRRLPAAPVYGGNNWYYAYGRNCSAAAIETDSALVAELSPTGGNRPFMVIDDGWTITNTAGPWDRGNDRFPDMAALAGAMKKEGVRPGIWLRPLLTIRQTARQRADRPAQK